MTRKREVPVVESIVTESVENRLLLRTSRALLDRSRQSPAPTHPSSILRTLLSAAWLAASEKSL